MRISELLCTKKVDGSPTYIPRLADVTAVGGEAAG
jgi:hypothetical protein